jgi:hypothetical protein
MMNFYKLFLSMSFIAILSACSSLPAYKQASSSGYGYSESKISQNHYRVHYKSKGTQQSKAMDFAMLRAAELTLLNGYDWFVVVDRETSRESESDNNSGHIGMAKSQHRNSHTRNTECGLLTCRQSHEPTTTYHARVDLGNQRDFVESLIEVRMGKGVMPDSNNSFSAIEVKQNLRQNHQLH